MRRLRVLADPHTLAEAAAEEFTLAAENSVGAFHVALSGGRTPQSLYELLADEKSRYRARIPWGRIHFFWGDERCVPPDHPDSNYRMAREAMLSKVPILPSSVHRVVGELPDHELAAERYEETILLEFDGLPRFDWVFLGMGAEGHTASLFPGSMAVEEKKKLVTAVSVPGPTPHRVTLTLPVLNASRCVAFVVAGHDKADTVRKVLDEAPSAERPASLVNPSRGELLWLLDQSAASRL